MNGDVARFFDAIIARDSDTVRAMLDAGMNPNAKRGSETALMYAAGVSSASIVRLLLEYGASDGIVLRMIEAACGAQLDTMRLFVERGGDVNLSDERGWTPLMEAATWGRLEVVRFLVEHGANVDAISMGLTARAIAARDGHPEVAEYLRQQEQQEQVISAQPE